MNTMSRFVFMLAAVCLVAGEAHAQEPAGTTFTYQGQLKKDGLPINDTCDLDFSLWSDPTESIPWCRRQRPKRW